MKICDYKNHKRFSLRCLGSGITLVSLKLRNTIRTHKSDCIIQKTERSLLNERVRNVNNTLDWLEHDRYMYEQKLSTILNQDMMREYKEFLEEHTEARHTKVWNARKRNMKNYGAVNTIAASTVAKLAQVTTQTRTQFSTDQFSPVFKNKRWVVNISNKPLSTAQETVLAHGPNFTVTPKTPPYQDYITANEVASQNLKPMEAEELRADIARVLKQAKPSKANIPKEEWRAIRELRGQTKSTLF